jgi:hypothetical protein
MWTSFFGLFSIENFTELFIFIVITSFLDTALTIYTLKRQKIMGAYDINMERNIFVRRLIGNNPTYIKSFIFSFIAAFWIYVIFYVQYSLTDNLSMLYASLGAVFGAYFIVIWTHISNVEDQKLIMSDKKLHEMYQATVNLKKEVEAHKNDTRRAYY